MKLSNEKVYISLVVLILCLQCLKDQTYFWPNYSIIYVSSEQELNKALNELKMKNCEYRIIDRNDNNIYEIQYRKIK